MCEYVPLKYSIQSVRRVRYTVIANTHNVRSGTSSHTFISVQRIRCMLYVSSHYMKTRVLTVCTPPYLDVSYTGISLR